MSAAKWYPYRQLHSKHHALRLSRWRTLAAMEVWGRGKHPLITQRCPSITAH